MCGEGRREEGGEGRLCLRLHTLGIGTRHERVENMFIHPCAPHDVLFIVDIVLNAVSVCT